MDHVNALLAAAMVVIEVEAISKNSDESLHSSVGRLDICPNSPNTVVANAELWVEFRSASESALETAVSKLKEQLPSIVERTRCDVAITNTEHRDVVRLDGSSIRTAELALNEIGLSYQRLDTISGHDALPLQSVCPSLLLFVPSRDGTTHSADEFTSDEDICAGFDGMTAVLSKLIARPHATERSRSMAQ